MIFQVLAVSQGINNLMLTVTFGKHSPASPDVTRELHDFPSSVRVVMAFTNRNEFNEACIMTITSNKSLLIILIYPFSRFSLWRSSLGMIELCEGPDITAECNEPEDMNVETSDTYNIIWYIYSV